ncbi:hypothetical protein WJX73_007931 [Symbiochloris irregularis]|uniref:FAD/NAD(P)-binding domain-containing protein n=1 Tax=Symbiochloris irregularis TaxID=706552 RepID=A0AAW1PBM8_9CHLO
MTDAGRKLRVVILGGGHGGLSVARALTKSGLADVKLVDGKGFFEINWATVRAPVEPDIGTSCIVDYADLIDSASFVRATVTAISSDKVVLNNGQSLPYDLAVFAVGTKHRDKFIQTGKGTAADRRRTFQDARKQLEAAKTVLFVGGGPVGVEMAAEIATAMPGKTVVLATSADRLLADQPKSLSASAAKALKQYGVKVYLNEKVKEVQGGTGKFTLQSAGTEVQADLVYWCVGATAHTDWLKSSHPDVCNERGLIKVDEYLRVKGHPNWFALGDCADLPETKLGYQAARQGLEVAQSIKAVIQQGPETARLTRHKPYTGMQAMILTLGKNNGAMHIAGWWVPWFLPTFLKSKDLFVKKTRHELGLSAPS